MLPLGLIWPRPPLIRAASITMTKVLTHSNFYAIENYSHGMSGPDDGTVQLTLIPLQFGDAFFHDYAGRLINDPKVALVELVANSWDAGAHNVSLDWPSSIRGHFSITDDGSGMSKEEFEERWRTLNYNRLSKQGSTVTIKDESSKKERKVYGRNGKGRHSLFCFSNRYFVETWKAGTLSKFTIDRVEKGAEPYQIQYTGFDEIEGSGTKISCSIDRNYFGLSEVEELLGSKFIADPSFRIDVNGHVIDPVDLLSNVSRYDCHIPDEGNVEIYIIDSKSPGRLSKHHGVAWWVNNRLVGDHSWRDFEDTYLDGRNQIAKRYTIIIKADILEADVEADWTWFRETDRVKKIRKFVNDSILDRLQDIQKDVRTELKREIIFQRIEKIRPLTPLSREHIGSFLNEVQKRCPTINQRHLSQMVDILANMEASRTNYKLLEQLADISPDDVDRLSSILSDWSIADAKEVLDVLRRRLNVISMMEKLVNNPQTRELQELQPLFGQGLWIFGPEFDSATFHSNRTLLTIITDLYPEAKVHNIQNPKNRPDFVVLPDASLGLYHTDRFDDDSEVTGIEKIIIIELKKGGSRVTRDHRNQAEGYAIAILEAGQADIHTKITCFVLGSEVDCFDTKYGENIVVKPTSYLVVLRKAHARTFNLMRKIKEFKEIEECDDKDMSEIFSQQVLPIEDSVVP